MRRLLFHLAAGLLVGLATLPVPAAFAQGTKWEYVGGVRSIDDLYLHDDGVLWGAGGRGIFQMLPGTGEWSVVQDDRSSSAVVLTEVDTILRVRGGSVQRSADGGETFEVVYPDAVFQSPLYRVRSGPFDGRLLASGAREIGQTGTSRPVAAFSDDDGLTWTEGDIGPEGEPFGHPSVYFSIPEAPGEEYAHRILAGAINGIAYSDDGGATWTLSELWQTLGYEAYTFAHATTGPLAGRLYAGVADTSYGRLYWSDDGGEMWTPQREFGGQRFRFVEGADGSEGPSAVGNPSGVLLVIGEGDGAVWRSDDGGATWARTALPTLDEASGDAGISVDDALLDGEGRLNVAAGTAGVPSEPDGLWRAAFPAVSAEGGPAPGKSSIEVSVWPNPAVGEVTVALSLPERAEVRVVVYDVLGREVVTLLSEGVLEAGTHRFALDGSGLPAGLYVVRAEGGERMATARITLMR